MNLTKLCLSLTFFGSIILGRNLTIFNQDDSGRDWFIPFENEIITIPFNRAITFTIPNNNVILHIYYEPSSGIATPAHYKARGIKLFTISIQPGNMPLKLTEKDWIGLKEDGLTPQEELITIEVEKTKRVTLIK